MSRLAWERDHAVSAAQSETELWKLSDERMDGKLDRYWNADWEETQDPAAAVYTGVLTESVQDTGMQNLQIVIREAGERGEVAHGTDGLQAGTHVADAGEGGGEENTGRDFLILRVRFVVHRQTRRRQCE